MSKLLKKTKPFWVYILFCDNNSYYTGYTVDLQKRFENHVNGKGGKYTRSFKPICIAQHWKIKGDKSLAMQLERFIKKLPRDTKEKIIKTPKLLLKLFAQNTIS